MPTSDHSLPPRTPAGTPARRRPDRMIALAVGGLRIGIGGALLLGPNFAGRVWMGPHGVGPGTRVFARAIGARDVALGWRLVADARAGRSVVPALRLGVAADAADTVATVMAVRDLPMPRRVLMPLLAASVAVLGALVTEEADEAEDAEVAVIVDERAEAPGSRARH